MREYFIVGVTFPAPIVGDRFTCYASGVNVREAIESVVAANSSGVGVYSADAYFSADDWHRGAYPVASWKSVRALQAYGDDHAGVFV